MFLIWDQAGQVTILVNLLCSVISKGFELLFSYANAVRILHLNDVEFINTMPVMLIILQEPYFILHSIRRKDLLEVLQNLNREAKNKDFYLRSLHSQRLQNKTGL
jgi:hypothetical protein